MEYVFKLSIFLLFILSNATSLFADGGPHCVKLHSKTMCPSPGGSSSCPFNQGSNCNFSHSFVQDFGYGGAFATASAMSKGAALLYASTRLTGGYRTLAAFIEHSDDYQEYLTNYNPECSSDYWDAYLVPAAGVAINGNAPDASAEEIVHLNQVNRCLGGFFFDHKQLESVIESTEAVVDPYLEEIMYQSAFGDVADFTNCQAKFLDEFRVGSPARNDLAEYAYYEFEPIYEEIDKIKKNLESVRSDIAREVNTELTSSKVDFVCLFNCQEDFEKRMENNPRYKSLKKREEIFNNRLSQIVARVPLGNRPRIRKLLMDLSKSTNGVSKARFTNLYKSALDEMRSETNQAVEDIMERSRINPVTGKVNYCVDRTLKKDIYRSGQLETSLKERNLTEEMSAPLLRSEARYSEVAEEGTTRSVKELNEAMLARSENRYSMASEMGAEFATLPLSLFGGFFFARLGAGTLRSAIAAGRANSAVYDASRMALIGIQGLDWATVAKTIDNSCGERMPFFSNVPVVGQACNVENEVRQMYDESSMAACATATIVPLTAAGVAFGAGRALRRVPEEIAENEIIVKPRTGETYFRADEIDALKAQALRWRTPDSTYRLSEQSLSRLPRSTRVYLLQELTGVKISPEQARTYLKIFDDSNGIITPTIERRLGNFLINDLGLPEGLRNSFIRRFQRGNFFKRTTAELIPEFIREYPRIFRGVPQGSQQGQLVKSIIFALEQGDSPERIRRFGFVHRFISDAQSSRSRIDWPDEFVISAEEAARIRSGEITFEQLSAGRVTADRSIPGEFYFSRRERDWYRAQNADAGNSLDQPMSERSLSTISPNGRLSLFEEAAGGALTPSQANTFLRLLNQAEGIYTPAIDDRLRRFLSRSVRLNSNDVNKAISQIRQSRLMELPQDVLIVNVQRDYRRSLLGLSESNKLQMAEKIIEARRQGLSEVQIQFRLENVWPREAAR